MIALASPRQRKSRGRSGPRDEAPHPRVRLVTTVDEFERLESAWSDLLRQSDASVFQSFEWHRTWWTHFGEPTANRQLHIAVVHVGGEIVAIAPFFIETVALAPLIRFRRLAFLGTGETDYLDVLVRRGMEAECCERLAAHLASDGSPFDVISLADIPDRSPTHRLLFEALALRGFEGRRFVAEQCPRLRFESTWDETLELFRGNKRRAKLLSSMRRMERQVGAELEVCSDPDRLERDIDEFMEIHQSRWNARGHRGVFADRATRAFQRDVARALFQRGWLHLAFLRSAGERVAAMCGFRYRGEFAWYLSGLRDGSPARKYSPLNVLVAYTMERLQAADDKVFDFLRGQEPYKYEFGAVNVPNWALLLFRRGDRLARAKNAAALLHTSLARRLEQERLSFAVQREAHPLFSGPMARYLWSRATANLREGRKKLRAPEKSLTVH